MTKSLELEQTFAESLKGPFPEAADLVIRYLEILGVEYVFGVPGGAIEPFYNALARSERRGRIVPVVARHESGAAFMADGYARETGRLGVCCSTTGPGATNMITGIASAYQDNTPMLVISAQTPIDSFGNGAVQESSCTAVDTVAMLDHCTHYNTLVSHPKQLERKLVSAITLAFHARGPVHLSIPLDLMRSPLEHIGQQANLASLTYQPKSTDVDMVKALVTRILNSKQIVIVVGEGCRDAMPGIARFAENRGAVIVTTPQAKGLVDSYHPYYRGIAGLAGHKEATERLLHPAVDLVLIAGSSLDEQAGQGWLHSEKLTGKLVHIDHLARHFTRSQHADLHICGDIAALFKTLEGELTSKNSTHLPPWDVGNRKLSSAPNVIPFERRARDRRIEPSGDTQGEQDRRRGDRRMSNEAPRLCRRFSLSDEVNYRSDAQPVKPQRLMYDLSRLFPPDTRYLVDIGNSFLWGLHYLHPSHPDLDAHKKSLDYFRTSMGFASMGWAIGASIGTSIGNRNSPVVCIVGDGSYLMSGQELTTAITHNLNIIFVVLNDQALGTVKHGQQLANAEPVGYELPPVDYAAVARAMGADGYSVKSPADFLNIDIRKIFQQNAPCLIDVYIDDQEVPPLNERMEMLSTAFHVM